MAVVTGVNSGFVTVAPVGDPAATNNPTDTDATAVKGTGPAGVNNITEIGWWCDNATQEANFEVGLYDHDVPTNKPGNLLFSDTVNAKGTGSGWKVVSGLEWSIDAGTIYWIAIQLDNTATTTQANFTAVGASVLTVIDPAHTELTDPFGGGNQNNFPFAIYAKHEAAGDVEEGTKTITAAAAASLSTQVKNCNEFTKTVAAAASVSLVTESYKSNTGFPTDRPSDYDPDTYWDEDSGLWVSTSTTNPGRWSQNVVTVSEEGEIYFGTV